MPIRYAHLTRPFHMFIPHAHSTCPLLMPIVYAHICICPYFAPPHTHGASHFPSRPHFRCSACVCLADHRDVISHPMDFFTLRKRIEAGSVLSVASLVADLNLIFDNAMTYNAKGSAFHQMATTLKAVVKQQQELYTQWYVARHGHTQPQLPPLEAEAPPAQASAQATEQHAAKVEESVAPAASAEPKQMEPIEAPVKQEGASAAPVGRDSRKRAAPTADAGPAARSRRRAAKE